MPYRAAFIILSLILLPFYIIDLAFAQDSSPKIMFTNVNTEGELLPNKEFKIIATIKNVARNTAYDTFVTLSAPPGLEFISSQSVFIGTLYPEKTASVEWIVKAESSGTLNVTLLAYSSSLESSSFEFKINIATVFMTGDLSPVSTFWGLNPSEPIMPRPGDTNIPLEIIIVNRGNLIAYNVTGILDVTYPFYWSYTEGEKTTKFFSQTNYAGPIGPDQNATLRFFMNIDPTAKQGLYPNSLRLTYTDGREFFDKSYKVILPVSEIPSIDVKVEQTEGTPGEMMWINFTITNNGQSSLHGLTIHMKEARPLIPLNTPVILGTLNEGESKNASFSVYVDRTAIASQYPVTIEVSYTRGGTSITESRVVGTTVVGVSHFVLSGVRVDPEVVYAGYKGNKLAVSITNDGYAISENLNVKLYLPDGFKPSWGGSDSFFLGRLMPRENQTAIFFVDIDENVKNGVYPIELEITAENTKTSINIPFIISGRATFEVVEVESSSLYPGASAVPLKIVIRNNGSSTAESVTAKLLGGNKIVGVDATSGATIGTSEFVGSINPSQSVDISLLVNVDPNMQGGNHPFTLEVTWQEGGKSFTENLVTFITLGASAPTLLVYQGIPWLYIIAATATGSVISVYIYLRAKRQNNIEEFEDTE